MEIIQEAFVNAWWWLQDTDEQHIIIFLTLLGSSVVVSWVVQHWKRRYNIDLKASGKVAILFVLSALSALFSIADWYLLNNPGQFVPWFAGYGSAIYMVATILHRIHVSPVYDKITNMLRYVADRTAETRQAKYGSPIVAAPAPAEQQLTFED